MCGIIGFKGKNSAGRIVFEGLKRLEYRGYDSWGIAINDSSLKIFKKPGKIDFLPKGFEDGSLAIGHTRWATHGRISEKNAHPHLSSNGRIAVVHNGIIENFFELKKFLASKGYSFNSETDTEVIPHLIQFHLGKGLAFREAVRASLSMLDGYYAIVAVMEGCQELIGARNGSPLVAGIGWQGEFFLASDVPAFLPMTKKVVFLEDKELVEISDSLKVFSIDSGKKLNKKPKNIEWNVEQAKKGDFEHFMLKEICEQPETIARTAMQSQKKFKKVATLISKADSVFFLGCGSSYHACLAAEYAFSEIAGKSVKAVLASEFSRHAPLISKKSVVVAVSQSGETIDLLEAVRLAKQKNAKTISIVNVVGSSLTRLCNENLLMNSGPEICVLSTKSYTAQLAIILLLAFSLKGNFIAGKRFIESIAEKAACTISKNTAKAKEIAKKIAKRQSVFVIGRGNAFPSALEAALKIKEVSYVHAEGFAGGELKHGPIALIEEGVPVIVFVTPESERQILSNAMEVKARGAFLIGVGEKKNEVFDEFFEVQEDGKEGLLLRIIPIQLLAYHMALERRLDPDKPRNLAKSVTVK
ncbi:MAG: glutamine--fructose-6-phosphate transaminase (isomerizing) [Candidatus Diapherotrites archaeon]